MTCLVAAAQDSAIRGSVIDPSRTAVAGAQITLSSRGARRTATADASGNYQFPSLASGTYTLTVEAMGIGSYENSSIHVSAGSVLDWPVQLAFQSASHSITVQGDLETLEQVPTVGKTGTMLEDIPQSISVISRALSDSQGDLELQDTIRNASGVIQGGTDGFGFADRFQIQGLYATDQLDLTARWKLRIGGRQDWWQTKLAPQINVPGRSLGNGQLIEPPNTYTRNDTPFS